jgi:type IV secretory pathway VirB9-like protein
MNNSVEKELYYTVNGKEDFLDEYLMPRLNDPDSDAVFAKALKNKKSKHFRANSNYYRYYIKGNSSKQIYDPTVKYTIQSKTTNHFINSVCKNESIFIEVSKSIFDKYIKFLQSKDIRWLKDSQRELI